MTGAEHYLEAERLVSLANTDQPPTRADAQLFLAAAQVHATLALAAATALQQPGGEDAGMFVADVEQWETAASAQLRNEQEG